MDTITSWQSERINNSGLWILKTALPSRLRSPNIQPMLARVLSAALSRQSLALETTADGNGIEAFPVEAGSIPAGRYGRNAANEI